jgi:NADH:ubiquinone oxidoreductase subunit 3 (subunit A)
MDILLSPPFAFLIYLPLVGGIFLFGRRLAGRAHPGAVKSSVYNSGEAAPRGTAVPGYRPFFLIAFFFAILHLGVLVLGSGGFTLITGAYMLGLALALVALILG